jgi:hypothetical protein
MVISQSVVGNRKPKLFSQLNELYGNARTVRSASDNHTLGRAGLRTRCDQACRKGRHMAAPTRVPNDVPWQDYDLPALDGMLSAELIFTIVYSAVRRVDW